MCMYTKYMSFYIYNLILIIRLILSTTIYIYISLYWGLGIGDWGLGPIPNPQSPIPNPQ